MKYTLKENDKKRVEFLTTLGKFILEKLGIRFTVTFLREAIVTAYLSIFEFQQQTGEVSEEAVVADRDDPSNLAIVLLEAFKAYHIKNEITEALVSTENSIVLAIVKPPIEKQPPENLLAIFQSCKNDTVLLLQPGKQQRILSCIKDSVEHFISLKRTAFTGQPGYNLSHRKEILQNIALLISSLILTATLGVAVYKGAINYNCITWLPEMILSFAGIFICYNLFMLEKMNSQDSLLVKKFCTNTAEKVSCQKVLFSKGAKLFGMISMTDIGAVYFATLFLFTVHALLNDQYNNATGLLFWLAVIPLPYTIFSLYYQFRVVKKVCVLCLLTQLLLWIQFSYFAFISTPQNIFSFNVTSLLNFLLLLLIVTGLYFLVVLYAVYSKQAAALFLENNRYKMDKDLFGITVEQQPAIQQPDLPGMLILGNPGAAAALTAILSPSCSPCGNMLNSLMKMADWMSDDICINILLKTDEDAKALATELLYHTLNKDHSAALGLLKDWYDFFSKEKEKGTAKLPDTIVKWKNALRENNSSTEVQQAYTEQQEWCRNNFIPYTPLLIYKGHFLPDPFYNINALINILEIVSETA